MYQRVEGNEIRLVILHPGPEVRCHLIHVSLEELPAYETVSYAWGDRSVRSSIFVNDEVMDVPASTKRVLQRVQLQHDRLLWIDAVCINQEDNNERSRQVTYMATIYSSGTANLVWLGEDDGYSEPAIASMQLIMHEVRANTNNLATFKEMLYGQGHINWKIAKITSDIDERAIRQYYSSPYFTRRWVIQESALAKQSICFRGSTQVPLMDVLRSATWIMYHYLTYARLGNSKGISNAANMCHIVDKDYTGTQDLDIFQLLSEFRDFQNEDPRDCIYALLALYQKFNPETELPPEITPDYSSTVDLVFTNAAKLSITSGYGLYVFCEVWHQPGDTLPSWVPHYDRSLWMAPRILGVFQASRGLDADSYSIDGSQLETSGLVLGKVERMTEVVKYQAFEHAGEMANMLQSMTEIVKDTLPQEQPSDVLGITLCGSRRFDGSLASQDAASTTFRTFEENVRQGRLPRWPAQGDYDPLSPEGLQSEYLHEIYSVAPSLRLFGTSEHIGLGPAMMEKGDILAILGGCPWPVVLRPRGDVYQLLGITYVWRTMYGEAVLSRLEQPVETFVLA